MISSGRPDGNACSRDVLLRTPIIDDKNCTNRPCIAYIGERDYRGFLVRDHSHATFDPKSGTVLSSKDRYPGTSSSTCQGSLASVSHTEWRNNEARASVAFFVFAEGKTVENRNGSVIVAKKISYAVDILVQRWPRCSTSGSECSLGEYGTSLEVAVTIPRPLNSETGEESFLRVL